MKRLLPLLLLLAACGTPPAPPVTDPTAGDLPVPFSYVLREAQIAYAWPFFQLMTDSIGSGWTHHTNGDNWTATSQRVDFNEDRHVTFACFAFDPEGDFNYGKTTVHSDQPKEFGGASYLIDQTGTDEPLHFQRSETVTLTRERSTETTRTIQMDIKVTSSTTGSGGRGRHRSVV